MADKKFFTMDKQFDESGNLSVVLSLDTALIREGILKNLTSSQLKVLLAIASHMDDNGKAYPSMRYLSEVTGISVKTVNITIKGLLDVRIDGLPIVTREIKGTGARKRSLYNFIIDTENPAIEEERMTPKDLVIFYCEEYQKEFGYPYKVTWVKEIGLMSNMMDTYSDEQIKEIIHTVITEYRKRWSNPRYPAPTIGAMVGWLGTQAMQIIDNRQKKETAVSKWDKYENTDEDLML